MPDLAPSAAPSAQSSSPLPLPAVANRGPADATASWNRRRWLLLRDEAESAVSRDRRCVLLLGDAAGVTADGVSDSPRSASTG